jgi:hypothetical protein
MPSGTISLVEKLERVMNGVVRKAVDARNQMARQYGDRPLFWGEGTDLDKLERYLDMRDNQQALAVLYEEERARWGRDPGDILVSNALMDMEELLDKHGGPQAVHAALLLRRIRKAEPVMKQIERIDAMPEYEVRGAVPAYDELSALTSLAAGDLPEFQPVIQTPADIAPPPPGGMTPYGNG